MGGVEGKGQEHVPGGMEMKGKASELVPSQHMVSCSTSRSTGKCKEGKGIDGISDVKDCRISWF